MARTFQDHFNLTGEIIVSRISLLGQFWRVCFLVSNTPSVSSSAYVEMIIINILRNI